MELSSCVLVMWTEGCDVVVIETTPLVLLIASKHISGAGGGGGGGVHQSVHCRTGG